MAPSYPAISYRKRTRPQPEPLRAFLSKLRLLRMRGSQLKSMPSEVIEHLDAAIGILKNAEALEASGLNLLKGGKLASVA